MSRPTALALLLLAAAARAGTVNVAPGDDVNAAIAAAAPGDTILFAAGTYAAPLTVPPGKPGLVLKAKGDVVIDGLPGGLPAGPLLTVQSDGVTVQGLTLQHAREGASAEGVLADDDGNFGTVDGLVLRDCRILDCAGPALLSLGDDVVLDGVTVDGCAGVSLGGGNARVERSAILHTTGDALVIAGDDAYVSKCTITQAQTGLLITGDRAEVRSCSLAGCLDIALEIDGGDFTLAKNTVSHCGQGITVGTGTILGLIESNRVSDCRAYGLLTLDVTSVTVRKNTIERCGFDGLNALYHIGQDCTFESNTVRDSDWHGWVIKGDGNLFRKCKSQDNLGDGFFVPVGAGNRFESCSALGNRGEGFQNDEATLPGDATGTQLAGCKAKGNRRDVAVVTAFSEFGVSYATGGNEPGMEGHGPEVEE